LCLPEVSLEEVEVVNDIVKGRYGELNWKDANSNVTECDRRWLMQI